MHEAAIVCFPCRLYFKECTPDSSNIYRGPPCIMYSDFTRLVAPRDNCTYTQRRTLVENIGTRRRNAPLHAFLSASEVFAYLFSKMERLLNNEVRKHSSCFFLLIFTRELRRRRLRSESVYFSLLVRTVLLVLFC